ncbi:pantoate--beta-alanine ligase [Sphingobacterium sp. SGG-5]|uniref:pantoate--beta-alanine ligase n=1 Tax=Sphingobacterium sp. SGG-5 TaxID=2710881 RepID=UPI0013EB09E4|nr:pantoate--beta-alanine ligase [Sphingobacterium sp. SGG-5]NGM60588.1 pantoate--beta-alanine ligase [Sphingobacterium sp. SGG-5]
MEILTTKKELRAYLDTYHSHQKIALVPTMGALHQGHLSLIREAQKVADLVVCSIFVNPTQFNDPNDLEKYPRPIEQDISLLQSIACDVLFMPHVEEIYPDPNESWHIDLGQLDKIWEGLHRPGHFQGVTQVVYKLFQAVKPHIACFGQKDFQQIMVVQRMLDLTRLPVQLLICPIVRDEEGLALSSRNARLSPAGKKSALVISKALRAVKNDFSESTPEVLQQKGTQIIQEEPDVKLEYFAICETQTLAKATTIAHGKQYIAIAAAWVEGVRLIDNMLLYV